MVPTSIAPLTFFIREDSEWMISQHAANGDDANARIEPGRARRARVTCASAAHRFSRTSCAAPERLKAEVETALWELVTAGMITADGFDNIRALIDPKRRAGHGRGHNARPRHSAGRWSLLYAGEPAERSRVVEATCWMLLRRYGVVFREMVTRETIVPRWRELLIAFRRLEDQGQIRGGRFVSGFLGEQFALPVAVESLRVTSKLPSVGEAVTIAAADPLNLVGVLVPGERVASSSGKTVTFVDGIALDVEDSGARFANARAV